MPVVRLNEINVYYEIHQSIKETKETIVLIHGSGFDSTIWETFIPYLTPAFNVVVFDLRGCGQSDDGDKEPEWNLFCDDIYQLTRYLKLTSFHLLGHAYGASLAVKFVNRYPDLVKGLVLISIMAVYPQDVGEKRAAEYFSLIEKVGLLETLKKYLIPALTKLPIDHPEVRKILKSYTRMSLDFYVKMFKLVVYDRPIDELKKVENPTVILAGEHDYIYMPSLQAVTANYIKYATFYTVPDASNPVFLEQPELTSKWIINYIQRHQTNQKLPRLGDQRFFELTETMQAIFDDYEKKTVSTNILKIELLNTFRVSLNGDEIIKGWNQRYAKSLLIYLIFHRTSTREQICDALFFDIPIKQALTNLKVYLNYLRRILVVPNSKKTLVTSDRQHISLHCEVQSDIHELLKDLEDARHETVISEKMIKSKRILSSLPMSMFSGLFDSWITHFRELIEDQIVELAKWTAENEKTNGIHLSAINYWSIALRYHSDDELLYDAIINTYTALGLNDDVIKWLGKKRENLL